MEHAPPDVQSKAPEHDAPALIRAVLAITDPGMRLNRLGRELGSLDPAEALDILEAIQSLALQGSADARALAIEVSRLEPTDGPLDSARLEAWRSLAEQRKSPVLAMLQDTRPKQVAYAPHGTNINEHLDDMSLGRRKALARTFDRQALDRLVHDKHPSVVEILLNNSRVIERDVVRMAANRPTSVAALETIAHHPRWIRQYAVRSALAQNPYCSPALALRLLPTLTLTELRRAAANLKLHTQVRDRARALLSERGVAVEDWQGPAGTTSLINRIDDPALSSTSADELLTAAIQALDAQRPEAAAVTELPEDDLESDDIAARFLANLGPLKLVPVSEVDDDLEQEAVELLDATDEPDEPWLHAAEDEHAGDDEADDLALSFLKNLGPIKLVPVGAVDDDPSSSPTNGAPSPPRTDTRSRAADEPALTAFEHLKVVPLSAHRQGDGPPPIAATPAVEAAAELSPRSVELEADVDAVAADFLANLGPIKLVPVGAEERDEPGALVTGQWRPMAEILEGPPPHKLVRRASGGGAVGGGAAPALRRGGRGDTKGPSPRSGAAPPPLSYAGQWPPPAGPPGPLTQSLIRQVYLGFVTLRGMNTQEAIAALLPEQARWLETWLEAQKVEAGSD